MHCDSSVSRPFVLFADNGSDPEFSFELLVSITSEAPWPSWSSWFSLLARLLLVATPCKVTPFNHRSLEPMCNSHTFVLFLTIAAMDIRISEQPEFEGKSIQRSIPLAFVTFRVLSFPHTCQLLRSHFYFWNENQSRTITHRTSIPSVLFLTCQWICYHHQF